MGEDGDDKPPNRPKRKSEELNHVSVSICPVQLLNEPRGLYYKGHRLALYVTAADEPARVQVEQLAQAVQETTSQTVEVVFVDQGYTGDDAAQQAAGQGIQLEVKLPNAKKGFVLLLRRWAVERSFGWMARFRRLARDYERLPETLKELHFLALAILMAQRFVKPLRFACKVHNRL